MPQTLDAIPIVPPIAAERPYSGALRSSAPTHHTSLMTLDLYRRDGIWFVDRIPGESELYSLGEFDTRFDGKGTDRAYLENRFGTLPTFKRFPEVFDEKQ